MKFLSDNFIVLMLTVVLGLSPLQSFAASGHKCMDMGNAMSHQLKMSDKSVMSDITQSDVKHDCCDEHSCDMAHCASGAVTGMIFSQGFNDIAYTVSNNYPNPIVSLITFYPSSLYRPPKA